VPLHRFNPDVRSLHRLGGQLDLVVVLISLSRRRSSCASLDGVLVVIVSSMALAAVRVVVTVVVVDVTPRA
jgi:hypothetical protein